MIISKEVIKKAIMEGFKIKMNKCIIMKNITLFDGFIQNTEKFINDNNNLFLRQLDYNVKKCYFSYKRKVLNIEFYN